MSSAAGQRRTPCEPVNATRLDPAGRTHPTQRPSDDPDAPKHREGDPGPQTPAPHEQAGQGVPAAQTAGGAAIPSGTCETRQPSESIGTKAARQGERQPKVRGAARPRGRPRPAALSAPPGRPGAASNPRRRPQTKPGPTGRRAGPRGRPGHRHREPPNKGAALGRSRDMQTEEPPASRRGKPRHLSKLQGSWRGGVGGAQTASGCAPRRSSGIGAGPGPSGHSRAMVAQGRATRRAARRGVPGAGRRRPRTGPGQGGGGRSSGPPAGATGSAMPDSGNPPAKLAPIAATNAVRGQRGRAGSSSTPAGDSQFPGPATRRRPPSGQRLDDPPGGGLAGGPEFLGKAATVGAGRAGWLARARPSHVSNKAYRLTILLAVPT